MSRFLSLVLLAASTALFSQNPAYLPTNAPTAFDVVSIHLSPPGLQTEDMNYRVGEIDGRGVTLPFLIQSAYGIQAFQVTGIPAAFSSAKYDFNAKMDDPGKEAAWDKSDQSSQTARSNLYRLRLQAMLADRFHLKLHVATKSSQIFALVVAKGAPRMKLSSSDGGFLHRHILANDEEIEAENISMPEFAAQLSYDVSRKVVDRTSLPGKYDFSLKWARDDAADNGATGPSLYTALPEQLGLKLTRIRGPVELYILDHIDSPTQN